MAPADLAGIEKWTKEEIDNLFSDPLKILKLPPPLNLKHPSNGLWDATETASRYKEPLKNFSCSNDRSRLGLALKSVWRCTLVALCNFTAIVS